MNSRRTLWMAVLAMVPVGCGLILFLFKGYLQGRGVPISDLFPQIGFFLYLHFLLPLIAVFIGSGVIADEVEDKTLPYLLVRPIPRHTIVLSKLLAGWITTGVILFVSIGLTYSVMNLGGDLKGWLSDVPRLMQSGGVLLIGLLVYMPFFSLMGGLLKHPVLSGILFVFGWENLVGFFPGNVKLFTIVHYLHVLFPYTQRSRSEALHSKLLNLVISSRETSGTTALLVLLGLSIFFTGLTALLLYVREYRLSEN
jgi:ABC-2 type transport system permease protein